MNFNNKRYFWITLYIQRTIDEKSLKLTQPVTHQIIRNACSKKKVQFFMLMITFSSNRSR